MEMNFYAVIVAAIIPIVIGFIWYSPKIFGKAWMKVAEMTEEKMKGGNMAVILGVSLLLSLMLALSVNGMVIHQVSAAQLAFTKPDAESFKIFMEEFGNVHRTFGHGALHGAIGGVFFVLPILGINALFERRGWKYIFIHTGYWVVTLAAMGALLCGWH